MTAISAGALHSCALTTAGGVKCWGANYGGALGDGTADRHYGPVDVSGLGSGVSAVAAGYDSSCALLDTGGVKCWGTNEWGRLGDGTTTDRWTPVDVIGLSSGMTAIAAGSLFNCALTAAGGVKCWGYGFGPAPADVSGLSNGVVAIAVKGPVCALTSAGRVKCLDSSGAAVDVPGLSAGVTAIATNDGHGCALTSHGAVKCWGSNDHGQLGDGTTTDRTTPVGVSGLASGVVAIAAGGFFSCAVTRAGGVKCWGWNTTGELGDGTTHQRLKPVDVVGTGPGPVRCLVPKVVGRSLANARSRIVHAHCRVGTVRRVASTARRNTVVHQSPHPGTRLKRGAKVNLRVSRGS